MALSKRKSPYVLLILLLLTAFLAFSSWSARQAATHGSQILDHNYYSKGLKYNHTRVEERAATAMGWELSTTVEKNTLRFILLDTANRPVAQASAELTLFLSTENWVMRLQPTETLPGIYLLDLPPGLDGSLQARIEFEKQGARISRQLLVNL